ncbi:hypothetical protein BDR26DRAFT_850882 [Obelidium mucronatum]|nr:hypothetical protein BDR26DRAFT_850882 [Obelidium mucronatum]
MAEDIQQVIATFRFPNPATTSMGIEFSDSEDGGGGGATGESGSDSDTEGGGGGGRRGSADFNPFKPALKATAAAAARRSVRLSSADLHNQLTQLEKLMADSGFSERERRKSSQAVVEDFLREDRGGQEPRNAKRDSYRKSTQSLLQFLLDSRQAVSNAASSPLPSTNNIFRGTDFVVKNANRMSTAVTFHGGSGIQFDSDEDEDNDSEHPSSLLGNNPEAFEAYDDEATDSVSSMLSPSLANESIRSSNNRNTIQSATLRSLMEEDSSLVGVGEQVNAPLPTRVIRPRVSTLKRPSDMGPPPSNTSSPSPSRHTGIPESPTLGPESKRRRSVPSIDTNGSKPSSAGVPPSPRPHTARRVPQTIMAPSALTHQNRNSGNTPTLLNIITQISASHFSRPHHGNAIPTMLLAPPTAQLTTSTIINELQQAALCWRNQDRQTALYKLHACAVSPWVRPIHDPEAMPGGITRSTVHPSALALYILAMCLLEGVGQGQCRQDANLGVLVLEMAAGVAVDDGGGRGENALKKAQLDDEDIIGSDASQRSGASSQNQTVPTSNASVPPATGGSSPSTSSSHAFPQRRGTEEMQVKNGGLRQPSSRPTLNHFTLVDPAWSLIDSFHSPHHHPQQQVVRDSEDSEFPPTPTRPNGPPTSPPRTTSVKRISYLHSLTPLEFLKLPTLRLAECYELGRGVKHYYQVWNSLGGASGFESPPGSFSSTNSTNNNENLAEALSRAQTTGFGSRNGSDRSAEEVAVDNLKRGIKAGMFGGFGGRKNSKKK